MTDEFKMQSLTLKALLLSLLFLVGCQQKSDVDKCIEAKWELFELFRKQGIEKKWILDTPLSEEDILKTKMTYRMECLHGPK